MIQCRCLNCLAYICLDYRHAMLEDLNVMKRSLLADILYQNVEDFSHIDNGHGKTRLIPLGLKKKILHLFSATSISHLEVADHGICIKDIIPHRMFSRLRSDWRSRSRSSSRGKSRRLPPSEKIAS